MTRLVFLDTETTGLTLDDDIWELAAIARDDDGGERTHHMFIQHDVTRCGALPEPFLMDHRARFPASHGTGWHPDAMPQGKAAAAIAELFRVPAGAGQPHVIGAVPNFDTERMALLLRRFGIEPGWHYHLIDVENLAAGKLRMPPPWDSEELSRAVGVDPGRFDRHSALGDARWARAIYDAVMGANDHG